MGTLLILLDDIATGMKIGTQKVGAILVDDLAVNADKSSGFLAERELPVLWAITKASMINKIGIILGVFTLQYFFPAIIPILLIIGGIYLAFEAIESLIGIVKKHSNETEEEFVKEHFKCMSEEDYKNAILESEKPKIKSAIITDFILSLEIIIIALSTVIDKPLMNQIIIVTGIGFIATVGVYGIVALLVRLDDMGYGLQKRTKECSIGHKCGGVMIVSLPLIVKALGYIGMVAMLLVAGGIFIHNIEAVHHFNEQFNLWLLNDLFTGLAFGIVAFIIIEGIILLKNKILPKK